MSGPSQPTAGGRGGRRKPPPKLIPSTFRSTDVDSALSAVPDSSPIETTPSPQTSSTKTPTTRKQTTNLASKSRVKHACEPCRHRKARCNGTRPICSRCKTLDLACYYADGKRERSKRDADNSALRLSMCENLLKELFPFQDPPRQQAIQNVLTESYRHPTERRFISGHQMNSSDEDSEIIARASVHSPTDQGTSASGYSGSAVFLDESFPGHWMHQMNDKANTNAPGDASVLGWRNREHGDNEFNNLLKEVPKYHIHEFELTKFGKSGENVTSFMLPSREKADAYVRSYFDTIHPLFPVFPGPIFVAQYESYWRTSEPPERAALWLAMLNLIFAIGALYGRFTQAEWAQDDGTHLLYFVRARLLSLEPLGMLHVPTIDNIQFTTLLGMYFVASCQLNRAWHAVGLSIRYCQSYGLHLLNNTPTVSDAQKEVEVRLWHTTCSLERFLAFLTGRTCAIRDEHNSQRFPRPPEDAALLNRDPIGLTKYAADPWFASSTQTGAFCASLDLDQLSARVLSDLYRANSMSLSWARIQHVISRCNNALGNWRSNLSPTLTMDDEGEYGDKAPRLERLYLAMRYFSISMLINRPCLCVSLIKHRVAPFVPYQSLDSQEPDHATAVHCVASARHLINLLPNDSNIFNVYAVTPWWSVLHYIVQAGAVLIIEIYVDFIHVQQDSEKVLQDVQKVLRCLKSMSTSGIPALNAWIALSRLSQTALSTVGKSAEDLPDLYPDPRQGITFPSRFFQTERELHDLHNLMQPSSSDSQFIPTSFQQGHVPNPIAMSMPSLPAQDLWLPDEAL